MLSGKILLTGGSGTLGRATLLYAQKHARDTSFTVYARSESRLALLRRKFPAARPVIGDVRDRRALFVAVAGHDLVIHMAAMKRIPECEAQTSECLATNVTGTQNVLDACGAYNVPCVVISTDKACRAATTYGASKLLAESLMSEASRSLGTKVVGVRYGNVIASTGSVVQLWRDQVAAGKPLTVTHPEMTRFWMSPFDAVKLIEDSLDVDSGTIAVPKIGALSICDMAHMLFPGQELKVTGFRSNEKLHEDLIHEYEPVVEEAHRFIIRPGTTTGFGYSYTSEFAPRLLSADLHRILREAEEVESC